MKDTDHEEPEPIEVPESPATWENVLVGKAKEAFGHLVHDPELTGAGEDQEHIAREVREEYDDEHKD
jgi:uncharacterized protein YjbJ (UPF0337 family)